MKKISDLKSWDVKRIDAMFEEHGTDRYGVGIVARAFSLTESAAEAMATAIQERNAPKSAPKPVTESAPDLTAAAGTDAHMSRKTGLAAKLVDQVRAAKAKPINECSIQELEVLAAAAGGEAKMFGG